MQRRKDVTLKDVNFGSYNNALHGAREVTLYFLEWNRKNTFHVVIENTGCNKFVVNNETVTYVKLTNDKIDIECSNLILRVKEKTKEN
jgi:hypothetical protein